MGIDTPTLTDDRSDAATHRRERGATIGRYVVLEVLGEGGMGVVHAAFDPQLDRKVAIKVLRGASSAEARERLLREAQAMAKLSHPNVVAVFDVGEIDDGVFLAMELVEGVTLREWLASDPSMPWRARLEAMKAAGRGLAAAHAAGVVHRDFKPANVLVGRDGRVRVTDFGLARRAAEPSSDDGAEERASSPALLGEPLTETGSILGTIGYIAPEQALDGESDARADQFSFSVTLYLSLYGEKPFPSQRLNDYLDAIDRPVRDAPADSKVPTWLRRVILRGLSRSPDDRYPSMTELLSALDRDPQRSFRRWSIAGVMTLAAVASAGLVARAASQKEHQCDAAAQPLSGVWDDAVKRDVRAAFAATRASNADIAYTRASSVLDAYASGLGAMQVEACRATRVRAEQSEEVLRLRADCLDRRSLELRALTSLFRRADAQVVDNAVKAAHELPSLAWCADAQALRANVGLPDDPSKRARALDARRDLAEASALSLGDKNADALAVAQRALDSARAADDERLEAEALFLAGRAQHRLGDDASALRSLTGAALAGSASGQTEISVRAAALLAYVIGVDLQRGDEAKDWIARANAILTRAGGNEELAAFVASREASILHGYDHKPELAAPIFERTAASYRRLFGTHPSTQRELKNLGDVYVALGRRDLALASYREALAMSDALFGPDAMQTGIALAAFGDVQLKLGALSEGTNTLATALAVAERRDNAFWIVATLQELSRAKMRAGDADKALVLGRRGLFVLQSRGASPVLVPASCVTTAEALLATGAPEEALSLCDRALEAQEKDPTSISPDRVYEWDALRCRGEALLATGRAQQALAPLERSVALLRREWPGDLALARFALARAIDASKGDKARALSLAQQARDELAELPDFRAHVAAIDKWLASRRL
jgi:tetratricopeptide (TPR) repeat protein/predicted Ser/Thr protein kinase